MKVYKRFITQEKVDDGLLQYYAGRVSSDYAISYWQVGAEETFSIGQPVYDSEKNLMGYMQMGLCKNLDYSTRCHCEHIPCEQWEIGNRTKHCEPGKQVFTFWQRWEGLND